MKRISWFLLAMLVCGISYAQKVELTLTDGRVVTGSTKTPFLFGSVNKISVKNEVSGEKREYESVDIKSGRYYFPKEDEWCTFVSVNAQSQPANNWNKNPKPFKKPVFMISLYEGEKIGVYKHFVETSNRVFGTSGGSMQINGAGCIYYYLIKGEDIAKAYAMSPAIGGRKWLRFVFKQYPGMKEIIESYDMDMFYKDPIDIIKKLESLL